MATLNDLKENNWSDFEVVPKCFMFLWTAFSLLSSLSSLDFDVIVKNVTREPKLGFYICLFSLFFY